MLEKEFELPCVLAPVETNCGLFFEERVGSQRSNKVHDKVVQGTMSRMFYPADVFQFIIDGFDNGSFSEHYSVIKAHQSVFHAALDACYQVKAFAEKRFKKSRGYH